MELTINVNPEYISEMMDVFAGIISGLAPVLEFMFGLWVAFYVVNKIIRWLKMI